MVENGSHRRGEGPALVRVCALFLDYDGTIGPLDIPRSESKVSPENMAILYRIRKRIPIALITTKDLSFIVGRTPFAHAWAGLGGLEMKIGDAVTEAPCLVEVKLNLTEALESAKAVSGNGLLIEEKKNSRGNIVAFSVDWRQAKDKECVEAEVAKMISNYQRLGMATIRYKGQPFFDVFPCPINKGNALLQLKRELNLSEGILYMGDSETDNEAFVCADVAVGVIHKMPAADLASNYFVKFEDVPLFLKGLLEKDLRFSPDLPGIMCRSELLRPLH